MIIYPNGEKERITPKNGVTFTVTELQDIVDGYIGIEDVEEGILVFDEDGGEKDKVLNPTATRMIMDYDPNYDGFVSGVAVLCRKDQITLQ